MNCKNCGAALTGEYCAQCGQRERGRDIRVTDLVGEALEDLRHLDGRVWRTLVNLCVRPGRVTADYFAGRRAHYLPPLRLYLIVSFIVFLIISLAPVDVEFSGDPNVDVAQVQEERGKGIYIPVERDDGSTDVLTIRELLAEEGMLELEEESPPWLEPWLERLNKNAADIETNPDLFLDQLVQRLPQMMFLLLPLFAVILWLAYLFSPFHYLQHLIFSLHYHTTAFLYYILLFPISWILPGDYGGVVMLALFIYLPIAMVRVYGSGWPGAITKGLVVGVSYYMLLLVSGAIFVVLSLAFM